MLLEENYKKKMKKINQLVKKQVGIINPIIDRERST
jgi:hypothetical protein